MMKICVLLIIYICANVVLFSQTIDNSFESLTLPDTYTDEYTHKKSKCLFPSKEDKVILFEQCFIEYHTSDFRTDQTGDRTRVTHFPDTCNYFEDGTKAVLIGVADNDRLDAGKIQKCVSFHISEMPKVGDTAVFEFLLLSLLAHQELNPQIYFSKHLLAGRKNRALNFNSFEYYGRFDRGSVNTSDLKLCSIKLPVTKDTEKYNWIHLVTDHRRGDMGLIVERDLTIKSVEVPNGHEETNMDSIERQNTFHILFEFDSFNIDSISVNRLESVIEVMNDKPDFDIEIRGSSDKKGDLEYNLTLAQKRAEIVRDYLLKGSISGERVILLPPIIGNHPEDKYNRSCIIELK